MNKLTHAVYLCVLLLGFTSAIVGQSQYKPAIEYHSFMDMRFYENQGGFLVERLEVVFPPLE